MQHIFCLFPFSMSKMIFGISLSITQILSLSFSWFLCRPQFSFSSSWRNPFCNHEQLNRLDRQFSMRSESIFSKFHLFRGARGKYVYRETINHLQYSVLLANWFQFTRNKHGFWQKRQQAIAFTAPQWLSIPKTYLHIYYSWNVAERACDYLRVRAGDREEEWRREIEMSICIVVVGRWFGCKVTHITSIMNCHVCRLRAPQAHTHTHSSRIVWL